MEYYAGIKNDATGRGEARVGEGEKMVAWTQIERGELVSRDDIQDLFCKWRGAKRTYRWTGCGGKGVASCFFFNLRTRVNGHLPA